jgi:hypothetical protein
LWKVPGLSTTQSPAQSQEVAGSVRTERRIQVSENVPVDSCLVIFKQGGSAAVYLMCDMVEDALHLDKLLVIGIPQKS